VPNPTKFRLVSSVNCESQFGSCHTECYMYMYFVVLTYVNVNNLQ